MSGQITYDPGTIEGFMAFAHGKAMEIEDAFMGIKASHDVLNDATSGGAADARQETSTLQTQFNENVQTMMTELNTKVRSALESQQHVDNTAASQV